MSTADDAWNDWLRNRPIAPSQREVAEHFYRRALEDAADEVERTGSAPSLRPTNLTYKSLGVHKWLRRLAAAVGTKDGADDE